MVDGSITIKTKVDQKGFLQGRKQLESGISGITKSLKGMAIAAGIAFGVTQLVQYGKEASKFAMTTKASMQRVADIFGTASKSVFDFAKNNAESIGLSKSAATQYAATYGNLFSSFMSQEDNAAMTKAYLQETAVVASKTGRTVSDVAERIRSGILGNTESIEDLGIQVNIKTIEMTDSFKKLAGGKSWDQLDNNIQQQIRQYAILEQATKKYGTTVANNEIFATQQATAALENLKQTLGMLLNIAIVPVIKGFTQLVNGINGVATAIFGKQLAKQEELISTATDAASAQGDLADATTAAGKAAKKALAPFDELNVLQSNATDTGGSKEAGAIAIPSVTSAGGGSDGSTSALVDSAAGTLEKLRKYISTAFSPSIETWGSAFSSLGEPAEKAFDKIKASTMKLWNKTLKPFLSYAVNDWVPSITNAFSKTFAPIFADVMPVVFEEFSKDFSFAAATISRVIYDVYRPAFEFIKTAATEAFAGVSNAWDNHGAGILEKFQTFRDKLKEIWVSLYTNVFQPVFTYIGNTVSWLWDKHLKQLWDNVAEFYGSISEFTLTLWNNFLLPFVNFFVERFGPVISFIVGMIGDVFSTKFAFIADQVSALLKILGGFMDFLTGVFTGDWEKAWNGIKKIFSGVLDGIYAIFKNIFNRLVDGLNTLWGGIYFFAKNIVDSIGGISGAIGKVFGKDWSFSMPATVPKIPKLATGAVIPPSAEFLAVLGDQKSGRNLEAPEALIRKIVREESGKGGGSGVIKLTMPVYLSDGVLLDTIVKKFGINNNGDSRLVMEG